MTDVDELTANIGSVAIRTANATWRLQFDALYDAQVARAHIQQLFESSGNTCSTSVEAAINKRSRKNAWILHIALTPNVSLSTYEIQRALSDCRRFLRVKYGSYMLGK